MDLNQEFEINSSPQFPNARCATTKLKKRFIYRHFSHSVAVLRMQSCELANRQDRFKNS